MTESEKQEIVNRVLSALSTNSSTIDQMMEVYECVDDDYFETNKGNKVSFGVIRKPFERRFSELSRKIDVFRNVCSRFESLNNESELPENPSEVDKTIGYIINKELYLYVGTGGNVLNGKYINVGAIVGPQGEVGPDGPQGLVGPVGPKGDQGNSGVSGSTDNIVVVNDLNGGESTPEQIKVLSAEQGKVLKGKFDEIGKRINELNISALYPTSGIDGSNRYDLAGAIAQVPAEYRTIQWLKVTFINNDTSLIETWVYNGGTFTDTTNWKLGNDSEKLDRLNDDIENTKQYLPHSTLETVNPLSFLLEYGNLDKTGTELEDNQYLRTGFIDISELNYLLIGADKSSNLPTGRFYVLLYKTVEDSSPINVSGEIINDGYGLKIPVTFGYTKLRFSIYTKGEYTPEDKDTIGLYVNGVKVEVTYQEAASKEDFDNSINKLTDITENLWETGKGWSPTFTDYPNSFYQRVKINVTQHINKTAYILANPYSTSAACFVEKSDGSKEVIKTGAITSEWEYLIPEDAINLYICDRGTENPYVKVYANYIGVLEENIIDLENEVGKSKVSINSFTDGLPKDTGNYDSPIIQGEDAFDNQGFITLTGTINDTNANYSFTHKIELQNRSFKYIGKPSNIVAILSFYKEGVFIGVCEKTKKSGSEDTFIIDVSDYTFDGIIADSFVLTKENVNFPSVQFVKTMTADEAYQRNKTGIEELNKNSVPARININSITQQHIDKTIGDVKCGWHPCKCDYKTDLVIPSQENTGQQYIYKNTDTGKYELHIIIDANTRLSVPLDSTSEFVREIENKSVEEIKMGCVGDSIMAGTTAMTGEEDTENAWNEETTCVWVLKLIEKLTSDGHANIVPIGYAEGGCYASDGTNTPNIESKGILEKLMATEGLIQCDICIMMLGINDIGIYGWNDDKTDIDGRRFRYLYRNRLNLLINYIFEHIQPKIIFLACPYAPYDDGSNEPSSRIAVSQYGMNICTQEILDICNLDNRCIPVRVDYYFRERKQDWMPDNYHCTTEKARDVISQAFRDVMTYRIGKL